MAQSLSHARSSAQGLLVDTPAGRLHAVIRGRGPDLLLLHGVTDSGTTWHHLQQALGDRYRTHALDLPGHGLSDDPVSPLNLQQFGRAALAYVERRCEGPVLVCGNSMGGGVALALAYLAPSRVRALCLLGSLGVAFPPPLGLAALRHGFNAELASLAHRSPRVGRALLRDNYARDFVPSPDDVQRFWSHWAIQGRPASLRALLRGLDAAEPAPWLSSITAPTAVVHGALDRIIPLWVAAQLVAHLPHARQFVLEGVGHQPQVECPGRVVELLASLEQWAGQRAEKTAASAL